MSDLVIVREKPVTVTTVPEWIGIAVVIVFAIVAFVIIYYILRPRLFSGSQYEGAQPPSQGVSCPTSLPPIGLTAEVKDFSQASFDASWIPVLNTVTTGAQIIGYNVYVNTEPNITKQNTPLAGFTPVASVRITSSGFGPLEFGTRYYYRVATVDTCGPGVISPQEFSIQI